MYLKYFLYKKWHFFKKNKDKIWSKYTLKRTKLHSFKKFSRGSMPPNPPSNAHGFAMRSMSLRDMQTPKSEKKISWPPPPPKSWGRPCFHIRALEKFESYYLSLLVQLWYMPWSVVVLITAIVYFITYQIQRQLDYRGCIIKRRVFRLDLPARNASHLYENNYTG